MKALVIGIDGFVGGHLKKELISNEYDVFGTSLSGNGENTGKMNILDYDSVYGTIEAAKPDIIFNMAGQASVAESWEKPKLTFDLNVGGTANILEAIKKLNKSIKLLVIGSSDQYGIISKDKSFVDENVPLNPSTPYAISKCTQEQLALLYSNVYDMNVYLTRSFNHIGIGQKKGFVIPDIASGIADIEAKKTDRLLVGNLSASRDFSDVRDIVRAYRMIAENGKKGTVYNVGSGKAYCIEDLMNEMIDMAKCEVKVEKDLSRIRKSDMPVISCNNKKLIDDTGWNQKYDIKTTLRDILDSFRKAN